MVLTSTPYKRALEEKAASKAKGQKGKQSRKGNSVNKGNRAYPKKKQKTAKARPTNVRNESDWYCFMCTESRFEDMIQCTKCEYWAHEDCAGADEATFVCELCK